MKKIIVGLLAVGCLISCNGRFGGKTENVVNDGHNYQWIFVANILQLVHSPECDTCRIIRQRETIAIIDSIVKDRIIIDEENNKLKEGYPKYQ